MSDSGVYFYARLTFPDADARNRWDNVRLDPFDAESRPLLAPFRRIWSEEVRTHVFGSTVGVSHVQHDEQAARRGLAPLIGDDVVERVEVVNEADGTRSYTFHLAGRLRRGTPIREVLSSLELDRIHFARIDEENQTELLAWLSGDDGFEDFVELLTLAALLARDVASGYGVFFPGGDTDYDLADYGELTFGGGVLRFEVRDIQDLSEEAEQWLNDALPRLRPLQE